MHSLTIVALSTPETISAAALSACKQAKALYLQTGQSESARALQACGIPYETMDDLYEAAEDFDALQAAIFARIREACQVQPVVYGVPGRLAQATQQLMQQAEAAGIPVLPCIAGVGFAHAAMAQAGQLADCSTVCMANALLEDSSIDTGTLLAIEELDTAMRAGEVKLRLLEYYPPAKPVLLCTMEQGGAYAIQEIPLYALDRHSLYHASTVLLVPPLPLLELERFGYRELERIMARLRAPDGCPWDAEQTHTSLKKTMIEECYEVLDAIDRQDDDALVEELGDVLLQCVFHAQIATEEGRFFGRDITTGIVKKLIYRHPHIFSSGNAQSADEVVTLWEALKKKEKHFETQSEVLQAVPRNLPALMRAYKVQKKAAQVGFDWDTAEQALPKVAEEAAELDAALYGAGNIEEEAGDLLFAVVNVVRLLRLEPEETLTKASDKFIARFEKMERIASEQGEQLSLLALERLEEYWKQAKST